MYIHNTHVTVKLCSNIIEYQYIIKFNVRLKAVYYLQYIHCRSCHWLCWYFCNQFDASSKEASYELRIEVMLSDVMASGPLYEAVYTWGFSISMICVMHSELTCWIPDDFEFVFATVWEPGLLCFP